MTLPAGFMKPLSHLDTTTNSDLPPKQNRPSVHETTTNYTPPSSYQLTISSRVVQGSFTQVMLKGKDNLTPSLA